MQAGILVLGQIATTITQAILPWFIVRMLGKGDVGAFAALMLVYNTLATLMTAGFPPAVLYFNAQRGPADRRSLALRVWAMLVALGAGAGALMWLMSRFGADASDWGATTFGWAPTVGEARAERDAVLAALGTFALYPALDMTSRVIPNLLISEQRPRGAALFGLVKAMGSLAATLVPAALGFGLEGMVLGMLAFGALQAVGVLALLLRLYRGVGAPESRVSYGHLLRFSIPLGMTDIINILNASLDSYLVMFTMSASLFAEYRMGAWQIPLVTSTAYAVGAVYLPRFVRLFGEGKSAEVLTLWRGSISKVSLIVVPVCAVFVVGAEEFCALAFTPEYSNAAPVFRIYSLLTMARVTAFSTLLVAAGQTPMILRSAALTVVSNVAVSVPMLLAFGYLGPPLGQLIAFVPTVAIYCYFISRALGQPMSHTFPVVAYLKVVAAAAGPCALASLAKFAWPDAPGMALAVEAGVILVGFAAVGSAAGLITREDWRFVGDWVRLKALRRRDQTAPS